MENEPEVEMPFENISVECSLRSLSEIDTKMYVNSKVVLTLCWKYWALLMAKVLWRKLIISEKKNWNIVLSYKSIHLMSTYFTYFLWCMVMYQKKYDRSLNPSQLTSVATKKVNFPLGHHPFVHIKVLQVLEKPTATRRKISLWICKWKCRTNEVKLSSVNCSWRKWKQDVWLGEGVLGTGHPNADANADADTDADSDGDGDGDADADELLAPAGGCGGFTFSGPPLGHKIWNENVANCTQDATMQRTEMGKSQEGGRERREVSQIFIHIGKSWKEYSKYM